ncbi:MAG: hypothetical protein LBG72_00720 [Spirochaetaceae bacterium]|jgi:hypothetical protein|nr:hypothetical protein [Spirochaetaceae bacterium]
MPKYHLVTADKIIGYDDETNKVTVYKPVDSSLSQLNEEELQKLIKLVKLHPNGGYIKDDEINSK